MLHSRKNSNVFTLVVVALIVGLATVSAHAGQDDKMREEYRAFGVAMTQGMSGVLDIILTRWSTEEERELLASTLIEKGQEEMVKLLRKQEETGFTRTQGGRSMGGFPSTRLRYAFQFEQDGKREIIIITDRPMSMCEAASGNRSTEYDISALVMQLEKKGDKEEGQGTLYLAVKLDYNKDEKKLEVESLGAQPIRLTDIKRQK